MDVIVNATTPLEAQVDAAALSALAWVAPLVVHWVFLRLLRLA